MKRRRILWSLLLLATFQSGYAQPVQKNNQDSTTAVTTKDIQDILTSKNFTFQAQRMMPMGRGPLFLNGGYDLRVSNKEVRSFLPYFGRLYMPPITPSDGPLRFESREFAYTVKVKNKGGWEVVIKPKDVGNVQELFLTIYDNGQATLRVLTTNRQPISFDGYITT